MHRPELWTDAEREKWRMHLERAAKGVNPELEVRYVDPYVLQFNEMSEEDAARLQEAAERLSQPNQARIAQADALEGRIANYFGVSASDLGVTDLAAPRSRTPYERIGLWWWNHVRYPLASWILGYAPMEDEDAS